MSAPVWRVLELCTAGRDLRLRCCRLTDLEEAVYQRYNAGRSGSLLRPRPYWDYGSRERGVLPNAVVYGSAGLSGYINWEKSAKP